MLRQKWLFPTALYLMRHTLIFRATATFLRLKRWLPQKKPGDFSHFRVQALACEFRTVFLLVTRALNQGFEFLTQSVNESRQFLFDANAFI